MTLTLYNTLTRRVEPFAPLAPPPARVTLYTCGPTVWNYAHIGNFRTFLFEDLLRHRQVPDLRAVVAPRYAGAQGRRAGRERRVRQGRPARFRAVEEGRAGGRAGRRGVGRAVRAGPARMAPRVLRHVARADREVLPYRDARHSRRRRRLDLPASRRRDRAVRSGNREAVRPLLAARRVPQRARHEDVEAVREFPHGARSARSGRGRRRGAAALLADALSQGAGLHRRSARGGGGGREAAGG